VVVATKLDARTARTRRVRKASFLRVLKAAATDKRRVIVIQLVRNVRSRLRHEFHFADQIATPRAIHLRAKLALHALDLLLPGFTIGGNFKTSCPAAHRARVSSKRRPHNGGPSTGKPRQRRFRPPHPAQRTAKKCSSSFHGSGILTQEASRSRNIQRRHRRASVYDQTVIRAA
jgi:hypothetical protein